MFIPTATGAFAYGGSSQDGTIYRSGAILATDGTHREFHTEFGLVEASAVSVNGSTYLAGRECDGRLSRTDIGVKCEPGRVLAVAIDEATLSVTRLDLGGDFVDPTGSTMGVEVLAFGDAAILRVSSEDVSPLIVLSGEADEVETLPYPPGPLRCSSGPDLWADATPSVESPKFEVEPCGSTVDPDPPGIVRLGFGASSWAPVDQADAAPGGIRGCSDGWFLELPRVREDSGILAIGSVDHGAKRIALPKMASTPFPVTNPHTDQFVVTDLQQAFLVNPTEGAATKLNMKAHQMMGKGVKTILTSDHNLAYVNEDLALQVMK